MPFFNRESLRKAILGATTPFAANMQNTNLAASEGDSSAERELYKNLVKLWQLQVEASKTDWAYERQCFNQRNLFGSYQQQRKSILLEINATQENSQIKPIFYVPKQNTPLQVIFAIRNMAEYHYFGPENKEILENFLAATLAKINSDPASSVIAKRLIAKDELINCVFNSQDFETFKQKFDELKLIGGEIREQDISGFNLFVAIINNQLFSVGRYMYDTGNYYVRSEILDILEYLNSRGDFTLKDLVHTYSYIPRDLECGEEKSANLLYLLTRNTFNFRKRDDELDPTRLNNFIGLLLSTTVKEDFDFSKYPELISFLAMNKNDESIKDGIASLCPAQINQLNVCIQELQQSKNKPQPKI